MQPNDGRVVSNFIMQALSNKEITIYGEGDQTRSFCYVDDLISGVLLMMEKDGFCGPINLGNPSEITIKQLASEIIEITGSKSKLIFKDLPLDDPQQRCPDISLAKRELKWQPKYNRSQGLKKTIEYFENILRKKI